MYRTKVRQLGGCIAALLINHADICFASKWEITPALSVDQHYTDNLFLVRDELKQDDYITEVDPAIAVTAEARRLNLTLDYTMQNLFYQNNDEQNKTNHMLQLDATSELLKDNVFFDVAGRIDQQTLNFGQGAPVDNINISDRSEVRSISLSPYYKSEIGGMMAADIRYSRGFTKIEQGGSDSVTDRVSVDLANGRRATKVTWDLSYSKTEEDRSDSNTVRFENGSANARYQLFNNLSLLANYGYANNEFPATEETSNGSYGSLGLGWQPNDLLSIDAVYGSQYQSATINLNPTARTSLTATWRDTDIGLNPGQVWSGELRLTNRRSQWIAGYLEDTTTFQQTQVLPDPLSPPDDTNKDFDPSAPFGFGVTDEVFVRKRGYLNINYTRARSTLSLNYYNETRIYQTSGTELSSDGGGGSWIWSMSPKTIFTATLGIDRQQILTDLSPDTFKFAEARIDWIPKRPFSANFTYRHTDYNSDIEILSYSENRVIVGLRVDFAKTEPLAE